MFESFPAAWNSPIYQKTVAIVLSIIFFAGVIVYFLRKKNYYFVISWISIKSWLVAAPILFIFFGLPDPWPIILLTTIAVYGAKIFFQIMGMYHRNYFVFACYSAIIGLGLTCLYNKPQIYNAIPMILLGVTCLIPLIRNSYKHMIQYISLTLLAFFFLGWSFMHLGLILRLPNGIYQVMYLIILTEFCDNTILAISRYLGGMKMFPQLDHRRTYRGFFISMLLTLFLAGAMRFLLLDESQKYWLSSGLIASVGGVFGDMVMSVVRRDAGVKIVGPFVLGRGDFLHRMDRLIFVAPIYYWTMTAILNH